MSSDAFNLNTLKHEKEGERDTSGLVETPGLISGSHFRSINRLFRCTDEAEEGV